MAGLTHLTGSGEAHMVDVGDKPETRRRAVAAASVRMSPETLTLVRSGDVPKGDLFAAARIAGIGAAKKTGDLIPLCHPLPLTAVKVDLELGTDGIEVRCEAETVGRTGVEMEAMAGASVAALTLYDMLKSAERGIVIESVRLLEKDGGKSGRWVSPDSAENTPQQ